MLVSVSLVILKPKPETGLEALRDPAPTTVFQTVPVQISTWYLRPVLWMPMVPMNGEAPGARTSTNALGAKIISPVALASKGAGEGGAVTVKLAVASIVPPDGMSARTW